MLWLHIERSRNRQAAQGLCVQGGGRTSAVDSRRIGRCTRSRRPAFRPCWSPRRRAMAENIMKQVRGTVRRLRLWRQAATMPNTSRTLRPIWPQPTSLASPVKTRPLRGARGFLVGLQAGAASGRDSDRADWLDSRGHFRLGQFVHPESYDGIDAAARWTVSCASVWEI